MTAGSAPPVDYVSLKKNFQPFLSRRVENRSLKSFWDASDISDDVIELAGGMPNERFFPIESMDLKISKVPFNDNPKWHDSFTTAHLDLGSPSELPIARSFQYAETKGLPPLLHFVKDFVSRINRPAFSDETESNWDVILSGGSNDSMFKVFETICDESTTVMIEEFTFTPAMSNVEATGAKVIPIKMNLTFDRESQGIDVEYLTQLLDNWSTGPYKDLNKPRVLYTIATGQNPTGMSVPQWKREKIYQLAQRHDFLIVEDDPYGYLYFPSYNPQEPLENPYHSSDLTTERYLNDFLMKSFLTLDTDARVIRLETFSKIFAPGLRLSFIVANKFLLQKILDLADITTRAPSGTSQAIVYSTIKAMAESNLSSSLSMKEAMFEGWIRWIMQIASKYNHRKNLTLKALYETESYQAGQFTVMEPSAGMFIIIKINWGNFDRPDDLPQQMDILDKFLVKNGVKLVLGYKMAVCPNYSKQNSDFLRLTIAYARDDDQLIEASKRIGSGIKEFFDNYKS
ncbi:Aro9p [Saccharomyces cerevisiae YJM1443]|nr:Aro9p [Saccharomyces cerevisiae YJM1443]